MTAGLAFACPTEPMIWYHAGPDGLDRAYQLRPDNPTEVGAMLLAANQSSVNFHYAASGPAPRRHRLQDLGGARELIHDLHGV